jgi:hypothetical protein
MHAAGGQAVGGKAVLLDEAAAPVQITGRMNWRAFVGNAAIL